MLAMTMPGCWLTSLKIAEPVAMVAEPPTIALLGMEPKGAKKAAAPVHFEDTEKKVEEDTLAQPRAREGWRGRARTHCCSKRCHQHRKSTSQVHCNVTDHLRVKDSIGPHFRHPHSQPNLQTLIFRIFSILLYRYRVLMMLSTMICMVRRR